jgi:hypothetical protein
VKRRKVMERRSPETTVPTLDIWGTKKKKGKNYEARNIDLVIEE